MKRDQADGGVDAGRARVLGLRSPQDPIVARVALAVTGKRAKLIIDGVDPIVATAPEVSTVSATFTRELVVINQKRLLDVRERHPAFPPAT